MISLFESIASSAEAPVSFFEALKSNPTILIISIVIIVWCYCIIGAVVGIISIKIANQKGRNKVGWFFLVFFFQVIPFVALICSSKKTQQQIEKVE